MVSPRSSIRDDASVHSSIEQQSTALEASALQPLGVAFLQNASEAAGVSLEGRVTALEPLSDPLSEGCERCVAPPVEQPTTSEVKSVLPLLLLGEACRHLALEKLNGKTSQNSRVAGISDEERMQNLLIEAKGKGITICKDIDGVHIKMEGSSKEEGPWECLKKIHDVMPIAHLECVRSENVEALLLFLQSNKKLVSLSLGESPNMTDEQLERISQHLPALKSFSVSSAQITSIPKAICSQIETLDCWSCKALTTLNAPIATTIECLRCTALTTLYAPAATTVLCNGCESLTLLDAPAATTVKCTGCRALTTLSAIAATTLDCGSCTALTTLNVPVARTVHSIGCILLTTLNAPVATAVFCSNCTALTTLDAPTATTIWCTNCTALTTLKAPLARTVRCNGCTALTKETRLKVLTRVRKNITLVACYAEENEDFDKLMKREGETEDRPLNRWFTDTGKFILPAHFASKAEENDSKQKIDGFLKDLITLASAEGAVKEKDLEWFKALKKLDSLQQQMKRVRWLGALVICSAPGKNPFVDPNALSTLMALGNLENPFLQQELTRALLSMYDEEASQQFEVWKTGARSAVKRAVFTSPDKSSVGQVSITAAESSEKVIEQVNTPLKSHQILPLLLFSSANLKKVTLKGLLQTLEPNYYKNTAVLTPILEMLCMLSSSAPALQKKLLTLIFKDPQLEKGERKDKFRARVTARRKEQSKLVTACRDLLFFAKFDALLNIENEGDLLETHKTICQKIFGVRDEFVHQFSDAFTSKRYSNALLTYAARLQILAPEQKNLLTELLGKFVNARLEGNFPACRYDLSVNPHLAIIFKGNPALLEKWVSPLEIDLTHSERLQQDSLSDPCELIKKRMATAIADGHLGSDQNATYPTLAAVLGNKSVETLAKSLAQLNEELDRLKTTGSGKNKQKHLAIEIDCLNALDPEATLAERIDTLNSLLAKLPNGLEFRNDVEGILKVLQPPRKVSLQKIESTEAWEDLLLMGTEVSNSCQRIDGDPHLNKCLLAYILDGKNKAIIVRDAEGKIAARSVLRILWNEKLGSPVLFMERVYTRTGDSDLPALIERGCMQKAKEMGLPLVASEQDFPENLGYEGVLSALGGPAPFEYVDALRGIQKDGEFEIPTSRLLYTP